MARQRSIDNQIDNQNDAAAHPLSERGGRRPGSVALCMTIICDNLLIEMVCILHTNWETPFSFTNSHFIKHSFQYREVLFLIWKGAMIIAKGRTKRVENSQYQKPLTKRHWGLARGLGCYIIFACRRHATFLNIKQVVCRTVKGRRQRRFRALYCSSRDVSDRHSP